jgi:sugar O-acyltransferase (sialic acid O-acetyltransferase NeuD family)
MHTEPIFLVGAGGHGKVVLDALLQSGVVSERIRVTDNNSALLDKDFLGFRISVPAVQAGARAAFFHVAIGNGAIRQRVYEELQALGSQPLTVMHPTAVISRFSAIGPASFVAARTVIGPAADIGRGVIINHGAVIDHDCVIGQFAHIAPNATLGGAVKVGARVLIGAGANVLPGVSIGDDAVIGAGAAVIRDVPGGVTVVGMPGQKIK